MQFMGGLPLANLSPASSSFSFQTKNISLARGARVVLGSEVSELDSEQGRSASQSNGWFAPKTTEDDSISSVSPLPLSSSHAEIWANEGQVYIRDLDSPFGTFVNDIKITKDTLLKDGDIIRLGTPIARNNKTPAYITDHHLKAVIAKIIILKG